MLSIPANRGVLIELETLNHFPFVPSDNGSGSSTCTAYLKAVLEN